VSTLSAFEYAVVRFVPRVEREEFVNVGVILFCDALDFLGARFEVDEGRLRAFSPHVDLAVLQAHLEGILRVCAGGAPAGPLGHLSARERFRWLVSPRSTIVQTSAAHGGLCETPPAALERLLDQMVRTEAPRP
jgi:hypothetical protein